MPEGSPGVPGDPPLATVAARGQRSASAGQLLTQGMEGLPCNFLTVTRNIIPFVFAVFRVQYGTVLAFTSSIVWLPRIPVGEAGPLSSIRPPPITLNLLVGQAQPEILFLGSKSLLDDFIDDGSVLFSRIYFY